MQSLPVAVVGNSNIGHDAATRFAEVGHKVWVAAPSASNSLGAGHATPSSSHQIVTTAEAIRHADIVLLDILWQYRFSMLIDAGGEAAFRGKIVIDAINAHAEPPFCDDLGACASSEAVAVLLGPGARVVKAFNTLPTEAFVTCARPSLPLEERVAIPLCGNDAAAKHAVAALIESIGFAAADVGTLAHSHLLEPHRSLYDKEWTLAEVRRELVRYDRGQNSN